MPETVGGENVQGKLFSELSIYRRLSGLRGEIEKEDPVKGLRGSIPVTRSEWVEEVVRQEGWLEG